LNRPEALTAAEVLSLVGRDPGEPVVITKLTGGYRNLIQRVEGDGFDWVVKQYAPADDNPLFPLRFDDEWRSLVHFEDAGIAPHLVAADRGRRVLVYGFVAGDVWDGDIAGMGALLSRVGRVAPVEWLRTLPSSVAELRVHTFDILDGVSKPPRHLLDFFDVDDEPIDPRLVHTDCGPGNVIGASGHFTLVDWQCPGQGDPVEDLAAFTSPGVQILYGRAPLEKADVDGFLAAYGDARVAERYRWKARLYSARFAAYCAWRIERLGGDLDADRYQEALAAELESLES
jgi:thiamine kinase